MFHNFSYIKKMNLMNEVQFRTHIFIIKTSLFSTQELFVKPVQLHIYSTVYLTVWNFTLRDIWTFLDLTRH